MLKIIQTDDGSHSLFDEQLNESYHSSHGAIRESEYVFIENGLNFYLQTHPKIDIIKIFEVGFGTGLNALLAAKWANAKEINVEYSTLEAFPLPKEIISQLNYTELILSYSDIFNRIHGAPWEKSEQITKHFTICKKPGRIEDVYINEDTYHVLFYDAFAPSKQPEMWSGNNLRKSVNGLKNLGVFVTYCAKGQLKRDLQLLNCEVESLPGPPGKREMVRATKLPDKNGLIKS